MNYYVKERKVNDATAKTAWSKARDDAENICRGLGYEEIPVCPELGDRSNASLAAKLRMHFDMAALWRRQLSVLSPGDTLFLQLPVINNCLLLSEILRPLKKRGVRLVALIHDLELLRMSIADEVSLRSKIRMRIEEVSVLKLCDKLIVHNEKMLAYMAQRGFERSRMVPLGIFDYLMPAETAQAVDQRPVGDDRVSLIVAGNLAPEKAGYVYAVPDTVELALYGVFYKDTGKVNLHHRGAFTPEELPAKLEGGFGLVWDGPSADTCSGVYGEYLRYNNPHKTSLYLASGLPVVIWDKAALAEFVLKEGVGITAASIEEAAEKAAAMSGEEYKMLCDNARTLGGRLRRGEFLEESLYVCQRDLL